MGSSWLVSLVGQKCRRGEFPDKLGKGEICPAFSPQMVMLFSPRLPIILAGAKPEE